MLKFFRRKKEQVVTTGVKGHNDLASQKKSTSNHDVAVVQENVTKSDPRQIRKDIENVLSAVATEGNNFVQEKDASIAQMNNQLEAVDTCITEISTFRNDNIAGLMYHYNLEEKNQLTGYLQNMQNKISTIGTKNRTSRLFNLITASYSGQNSKKTQLLDGLGRLKYSINTNKGVQTLVSQTYIKGKKSLNSDIAKGYLYRNYLEKNNIYPLAILPRKIASQLMTTICPEHKNLNLISTVASDKYYSTVLAKNYSLMLVNAGRGHDYIHRYEKSYDDGLFIDPEKHSIMRLEDQFIHQEIIKKENLKQEIKTYIEKFKKGELFGSIGLIDQEKWEKRQLSIVLSPIQEDYVINPQTNPHQMLTAIQNNKKELHVCFSAHPEAIHIPIPKHQTLIKKHRVTNDPILFAGPVDTKKFGDNVAVCMQYSGRLDEKKAITAMKKMDIPAIMMS